MRETIVDRAYARTLLPARREDGHKGDFGKLLVLGGSVGYTGAPYLTAGAAVHSGCGLVYLGVPESIWAVEAQKCVSAMPFPLPEEDGKLCLASLDAMQEKLNGCDALALGPGLGRGEPNVLSMEGTQVFKFAVETVPACMDATLKKAGLTPADIDFFVFHQANARIIDLAVRKYRIPPEKYYKNIDRYGNTAAASVPLVLSELVEQGRVGPGSRLLLTAFGGGLTWGGAVLEMA